MKFIGDNWVFGQLGVQTGITVADRMSVLECMQKLGYKEKKILNETCNLIMSDQITVADAVSQTLITMALFRHRFDYEHEDSPDRAFLEKCC